MKVCCICVDRKDFIETAKEYFGHVFYEKYGNGFINKEFNVEFYPCYEYKKEKFDTFYESEKAKGIIDIYLALSLRKWEKGTV